jgi:TatD DNase family protein
MFIDVHCHLEMCEKPEEILEEAEKKKVIVTSAGTNEKTNEWLLSQREQANLRICLGLYPLEAVKCSDDEVGKIIDIIRKNSKRVWGIGEVGLDYKESADEEEHEKQKKVFRKFIELAIELNKPVVVHSRKAEEDCISILEELKAKKVIMHCFSGKMSFVKRIIENKWFLSIPTSVNNSEHFQEIINTTPIEQLLCETDAPYLHPDKSWPNSPLNVVTSYKKIAEIKGLNIDEVEKQIEKNVNLI